MRPRFNKVNLKYNVGPDKSMLYAHVIVPKAREGELRTKLNAVLGWWMARNRLLAMNNETERYKTEEYEPKLTNGKRGRPRLTIDNDGNVAEEVDEATSD
jgi:hypothetical protein